MSLVAASSGGSGLGFGVGSVLTGLLFIALAVPLVLRKVAPNGNPWAGYGIRFPYAYKSDRAWYAINAFGGKVLIVCGIIIIGLGAVMLFEPFRSTRRLQLILLGIEFAVVILSATLCWIYSLRFADAGIEQENKQESPPR